MPVTETKGDKVISYTTTILSFFLHAPCAYRNIKCATALDCILVWLSTDAGSFIVVFVNFTKRSLVAPVSGPEDVESNPQLI